MVIDTASMATDDNDTLFERNPMLDSDSDDELAEAFAAGILKPGLVIEEQKKTFINNKEGLNDKIKEFSLSNLKWIERLDLTNEPAKGVDVNAVISEDDDFKREMKFYRQAQASALAGLTRLASLSVATKRPEDYFAEMAKSDDHMKKVRSKLLEKKMSLERSEKAKKLRELRKYGKKVQHEVLQKRQKEKREMLDSVKKFRKGQVDKIDIMGESIQRDKQQNQNKGKNMKPNKKRDYKNKKFGFGGQKKRSKYNTADSAADVSGFSANKVHGKGAAGNKGGKKALQQRPGKNRRKVIKNKNKKR